MAGGVGAAGGAIQKGLDVLLPGAVKRATAPVEGPNRDELPSAAVLAMEEFENAKSPEEKFAALQEMIEAANQMKQAESQIQEPMLSEPGMVPLVTGEDIEGAEDPDRAVRQLRDNAWTGVGPRRLVQLPAPPAPEALPTDPSFDTDVPGQAASQERGTEVALKNAAQRLLR